jgi:hypothetical protein
MRKLILVSVLIVGPLLTLGSAPASAYGWYGYGCGACRYSEALAYRSYYRPRFAYGGFYRPRVWGWRGWGGRAWGWRGGRRW